MKCFKTLRRSHLARIRQIRTSIVRDVRLVQMLQQELLKEMDALLALEEEERIVIVAEPILEAKDLCDN
jgi:hypothetical protein